MGQGGSLFRSLEDVYHLQKVKLGQGSFGSVWRGVDKQTNEVVAIKQMDRGAIYLKGLSREDIESEMAVMKTVRSENILRLIDSFEDHCSIYLALEYCDGGDLGDKIKERGTSLQEPDAADWMRQICAAVSALHRKDICHRDIKPDNFMVHGDLLKLADFGLAVHLSPGQLLTDKCGTALFMSPEQHKLPMNSRGYAYPCDVWAAGICLYMLMLGGRHPFQDSSGRFDERRLHMGELDFSANSVLGLAGIPDSRFSEEARTFCKHMVTPSPQFRKTADECLQDPWFDKAPRRRNAVASKGAPVAIKAEAINSNDMGEVGALMTVASNEFQKRFAKMFCCKAQDVAEDVLPPEPEMPDEAELTSRIRDLEAELDMQRESLQSMQKMKTEKARSMSTQPLIPQESNWMPSKPVLFEDVASTSSFFSSSSSSSLSQ